jgi:hypothetical protein
MTTACLWADLDTYLISAVTTDMGASSGYTTLQVGQVILGTEIDEQHATLPAVMVVGERAQITYDEFGAYNTAYPYLLVAVHGERVSDMSSASSHTTAYTTLKANLQELARRLRLMVDGRGVFGGLAATDGERVWDVTLGDVAITLWGPVEKIYYGAAEVPLTVKSRTP